MDSRFSSTEIFKYLTNYLIIMIAGNRWRIIQLLSEGKKTPTELATLLKISLPSLHEHLTYLEKENMIMRTEGKKGKTRPYTEYSLGQGFVYFIKAMPGEAEQKFMAIDEDLKLHLRVWSIPQKGYHHCIEAFWWELQGHLDSISSMGVYGSVARGDAKEGSDIDILLLVKKDVKKYEKLFGAKLIGPKGKGEMVMAQVFEAKDFENSLKKGSKFAQEVLKEIRIIYDQENIIEKLKKWKP